MNGNMKNFLIWAAIFIGLFLMIQMLQAGMTQQAASRLVYSDFLLDVEQGNVAEVTIKQSPEEGTQIEGSFQNGQPFVTQGLEDPALVKTLRENNVKIAAAPASSGLGSFWGVLLSWFPFLLLIGVYFYFMRQMQGGSKGGGAMGFGKSRARMLTEEHGRKTFDDVAGIDEAKEELVEIVEFLKDPQKFQKLGGKIPKGCLLVGPPEPVRPCLRERLRAKRAYHFSPFRARIL